MDSGLSKLPNDMVFPVMKELYLQDNKYILAIPPSFFHFMPSLEVLDMSRTSIKKLPSSISKLIKLKKLFLRDCKLLMELPPEIQDLKNLRLFDLSGTELIYIPVEIKHLLRLKCLRMSLCASAGEYISEINESLEIEKWIEIMPKNTLRKLVNLQELSIFVDLNCKWWGAIVESIILDLVRLKKLQILKLYFPTVHLLQRLLEHQVVCESLSDFRFLVGHEDQHIISRFFPQQLEDEFETLRECFKYVNGRDDINEVDTACKYARTLFLDRHWSIERLSVLKNSCNNLRFCVLVECNKMKNIIDGHDLPPEDDNEDTGNAGNPAILSLQYLRIHYMKSLTSIWVGPFRSGSLNNLQILALSACPNLNTILDERLVCNLPSLKELIVEDCPNVETLVSIDSSNLEFGIELLPCLQKITLLFLPELVSISRGLEIAPRLVRIFVYGCPKLQTISPNELCSKCIKEIKGESEWWEALERSIDQLDVFVSLGGDDLMNQLAEARISRDTLSMIQFSNENEVDTVAGFEVPLQPSKSMPLEVKRPVLSNPGSPLPFATFRRSILGLGNEQVHSMEHGSNSPDTELESFQKQVFDLFHELSAADSDELLSLSWIKKLLDVFIICQDQFRVILSNNRAHLSKQPVNKIFSDYFERSIKALDICNATREGLDKIRQWQKQLEIVGAAFEPKQRILGEGQFRRARKGLMDLSLLMLDEKDTGSVFSHRNRSFGRQKDSSQGKKPGHSRSLSWSVSQSWSASKQVQSIANNLVPPRGAEISATSGLAVPVFTMGFVILFAVWVLVAAIPCQDRNIHTSFTVPRQFTWGVPMYFIQVRIMDESKKRERKNPIGLLKEIHQIEKSVHQITELVDSVNFPLSEEQKEEVKNRVDELSEVCEACKNGLDPLERHLREVFLNIRSCRIEGLELLNC